MTERSTAVHSRTLAVAHDMMLVLLALGWAFVAGLALLFILSKCWFLAPYPIGWIMLIPNTIYETAERKGGLPREPCDLLVLLAVTIGATLLGGPWIGAVMALACGLTWIAALFVEMRWRSDVPARQFASKPRVPLPIPLLIVQVRGPVLTRSRQHYSLGYWPAGLSQDFELLILNPGIVRPQLPLQVELHTNGTGVKATIVGDAPVRCPEPSEVIRVVLRVTAGQAGTTGEVRVHATHGDWSWQRTLRLDGVVGADAPVVRASITRWKHGTAGAFNWRGDHDLYDPPTFQSADGLRRVLGLAMRFRLPTSIMLSAKLNLDQPAHEQFCKHYGWDRHSEEIPSFIEFLRTEVDTALEQEFPVSNARPLAAEIGNHCYLHYGTHAAADPGNEWKSHARMGAGKYEWMSTFPCDSLTEQRDNLLKGSELIEKHLGFRPASYTIPGDVKDEFTPRAVEAAGLEVSSEVDASKLQKLLFFPRQHHPVGCERLVELTRVLPKDPVNASQIAMLKFWVGVARRTGRAMVYLAHHHVLLYKSNACFNLTAELVRSVLADNEGEIWCGTLTTIGRYWRDVLSERTRCVRIEVTGGEVVIHNDGDRVLSGVPVELDDAQGRRHMRLVEVPPRGSIRIGRST